MKGDAGSKELGDKSGSCDEDPPGATLLEAHLRFLPFLRLAGRPRGRGTGSRWGGQAPFPLQDAPLGRPCWAEAALPPGPQERSRWQGAAVAAVTAAPRAVGSAHRSQRCPGCPAAQCLVCWRGTCRPRSSCCCRSSVPRGCCQGCASSARRQPGLGCRSPSDPGGSPRRGDSGPQQPVESTAEAEEAETQAGFPRNSWAPGLARGPPGVHSAVAPASYWLRAAKMWGGGEEERR